MKSNSIAQLEPNERSNTRYDFANILFSGPCNQRCPYCIGRQIDPSRMPNNLNDYPPPGWAEFTALIQRYAITEIILTGTNTDPQLYRHEERLLSWIREKLPHAHISLHTNGQLALDKMDALNRYDRATISFPSFDTQTFFEMTGVRRMPDLAEIVRRARIPIKISCVLTRHNVDQVPDLLTRCQRIGIRRVALRECYGNPVPWRPPAAMRPVGEYRGNPVYDYHGLQVTYWRFEHSACTSLNLFADGSISSEYLLAPHPNSVTKRCASIFQTQQTATKL